MTDPTEHWPQEWRSDFRLQNGLLEGAGDEPLTPAEFLRCRHEDNTDRMHEDDAVRAQRHHEVFLKVIEELAGHFATVSIGRSAESAAHDQAVRELAVGEARAWADLAYPKVQS